MRILLTFALLVFSLISNADPVLERGVQTAQFSAFAQALHSQSRIPMDATIQSISVANRFNAMAVFGPFRRHGLHFIPET